MHQDQQQPPSRGGQTVSDGPTVEDHGRVVTATMQAAAFYRQAQQAVDSAQTVTALRRAVNADLAFGLAIADLDAITQAPPSPISGDQVNLGTPPHRSGPHRCRWQHPSRCRPTP